jgi:hypothetical protein
MGGRRCATLARPAARLMAPDRCSPRGHGRLGAPPAILPAVGRARPTTPSARARPALTASRSSASTTVRTRHSASTTCTGGVGEDVPDLFALRPSPLVELVEDDERVRRAVVRAGGGGDAAEASRQGSTGRGSHGGTRPSPSTASGSSCTSSSPRRTRDRPALPTLRHTRRAAPAPHPRSADTRRAPPPTPSCRPSSPFPGAPSGSGVARSARARTTRAATASGPREEAERPADPLALRVDTVRLDPPDHAVVARRPVAIANRLGSSSRRGAHTRARVCDPICTLAVAEA